MPSAPEDPRGPDREAGGSGDLGRPGGPDGGYRFCPLCASPLAEAVRGGRPRAVCPACGWIHWRNPVVGVAAILRERSILALCGEDRIREAIKDPDWTPSRFGDRVLLVRRAASRRGLWCLPCGYVEHDEDVRAALRREIREETGLEVEPGTVAAVHSNFHDPDRPSVGIWFEAAPIGGELRAGDDVDRVGLFLPGSVGVPLAFPTDSHVLADLVGGNAIRE